MPPSHRNPLYASPIQQVLVLSEENASEVAAHERERQAVLSSGSPSSAGSSSTSNAIRKREDERPLFPWRVKDLMKTAHVVLMVCLNIGVDPPDVPKPEPCARLECWINPSPDNPESLQMIVSALTHQYEQWQSKSKFFPVADPTGKDLKNACARMRKGAKEDRVLFHYNGHGVPDPTNQGEIWVFNHGYTQYIPLPLGELHEWLGSPSILVFDCNSAGRVLYHFKRLIDRVESNYEEENRKGTDPLPSPSHRKSIALAACGEGERLPLHSQLPADLFTCCLTTPIKTVLHWFVQRTLVAGITDDMVDRVPGSLTDRHTPLGELNWIFAAVTDAIAWNVLPREKFLQLYRQDMLLASLLRNFLLAERVMRTYGCHPVSYPPMPETHSHCLWKSFDVAVEKLFAQLPTLVAEEETKTAKLAEEEELRAAQTLSMNGQGRVHLASANAAGPSNAVDRRTGASSTSRRSLHPFENGMPSSDLIDANRTTAGEGSYVSSTFFEDQMKAFDVWLDMGPDQRGPPEQLPIMLQVLLSAEFRKKALPLLSRYLQTGPVAVDLFLSVGIFPYVMKLLEIESEDQRQELVFIWSKILALDSSCSDDLINMKGGVGVQYFVRFLTVDHRRQKEPKDVYLAVAMFVLSVIAKKIPTRCREIGLIEACCPYLSHTSPFVRRWACLCIMTVMRHADPPSQSQALADSVLMEKLRQCATTDCASDVRASATAVLSAVMGEILHQQNPQDGSESEHSSQCSRSEYQPNRPKSDIPSLVKNDNSPADDDSPPSDAIIDRGGDRIRTAAEIVMENCFHTPLVEAEFLDAPVSPYSGEERDALFLVGSLIAEIGRRDSSVLVRREVSIAIARSVRLQRDRFVRAAYITDVIGIDETKEAAPQTDIDKCEAIYRKLWMTLSELAFDPHPIVAALARRSYDRISEVLLDRAGPVRGSMRSSSSDEIPPTDHAFSPPTSNNSNFLIAKSTSPGGGAHFDTSSATGVNEDPAVESWRNRVPPSTGQTGLVQHQAGERENQGPPKQGSYRDIGIPPLVGRSGGRPIPPFNRPGLQRGKRTNQGHSFDVHVPTGRIHVPTGSIHVRSTSGSFDLNVSARLPGLSRIPRVNSASLITPLKNSSAARGLSAAVSSQDLSVTRLESITDEAEVRPRSAPRIVQGVGTLWKTVSAQLHRTGIEHPSAALPRSFGSNSSSGGGREDGTEGLAKPQSPPRPPKRSLSYQVLNATTALSSGGEIPILASSRPTYFATTGPEGSDENLGRLFKNFPAGYDRLYLSQHGDAALSLFEWSSASVARVECDANRSDHSHQKESVPRYAALWDKFLKSSGNIPSESLRAFALLGEGHSGMAVGSCRTDDVEGKGYRFLEISSHTMGAGGGAVTSMAFLPRDIGMGEDQLIATGDSTGAVGVYDVRNGLCQASVGVPFPPGIPDVGISAVLCLNRPSPATIETDSSFGNSRSALILAGAYDGRVAIFKSDLNGPKYRIMSTFQGSGRSYWSKVGTVREPIQKPSQHNVMHGTYHSSDSADSLESYDDTFADVVKDSGNGLVLAFASESSYLAAGGCDAENIRVWDLAREYCIWEGAGVEEETWPTAVTMWGRINKNVFVTGSSKGTISVIDMRERPAKASQKLTNLGRHTEPIISLGTCPPIGSCSAEVVISADIGGEIAFWDARWTSSAVPLVLDAPPGVSHIKAHRSNLTSMAVHPAGTLIATGSSARCVKIFGPNRAMLKMIPAHDSETGHALSGDYDRIPPVTSLSFQPESNLLAIGSLDSTVMVYGRPDTFPGVHAHEDQISEAERAALYEYGR